MSLDGYIAGPNDGLDNPMGDNAGCLHDWVFGGKANRYSKWRGIDLESPDQELLREVFINGGAAVFGRYSYDLSPSTWGDRPPYQVPCFVVTHEENVPPVKLRKTSFTFMNDVASAINAAKVVAGQKNVNIVTPSIARQALVLGLVDLMQIHVVPVLLGKGKLLFTDILPKFTRLQVARVVPTDDATHILYQVR